jgi:16S rRNA (guanine966-N2)-methyltransferase
MCGVTRIIAGTAGGRRLQVPKGTVTRPTSDRVREAVFSVLESRGVLLGARVLDLYSGSGALGLEAASRGAAEVVLVDSSRHATDTARRNAASLGLERVTVVLSTVARYLVAQARRPADLVLLDPPYDLVEDELGGVLAALLAGGWLDEDAVLVVERSSRGCEPRWPVGLLRQSVRRYGETTVWTAQPAAPRC